MTLLQPPWAISQRLGSSNNNITDQTPLKIARHIHEQNCFCKAALKSSSSHLDFDYHFVLTTFPHSISINNSSFSRIHFPSTLTNINTMVIYPYYPLLILTCSNRSHKYPCGHASFFSILRVKCHSIYVTVNSISQAIVKRGKWRVSQPASERVSKPAPEEVQKRNRRG